MRFPFVSRRNADFTKGLVCIQLAWEKDDHAETREVLAETQHRLSEVMAELEAERAKRERLKTYLLKSHSGRYEMRLARTLRAVTELRAEAAVQRRVVRGLTDQLLDATGYQAEPLLPAARAVLDLDQEDPK